MTFSPLTFAPHMNWSGLNSKWQKAICCFSLPDLPPPVFPCSLHGINMHYIGLLISDLWFFRRAEFYIWSMPASLTIITLLLMSFVCTCLLFPPRGIFHCKALPFHNSQCLYHGHFSVPSFSISTFPTFFPPRGILYITYARIPYDHHLASRVLCLHLIPFFSPHGISILASIANHCLFITVNAFNMGIFLFHPFLSPPFLTFFRRAEKMKFTLHSPSFSAILIPSDLIIYLCVLMNPSSL